MDDRLCAACQQPIQQPASGRRRKYSYVCSPPNMRAQLARVTQLPVREPSPEDQRLTRAVERQLAEWEMENTWPGEAALVLARQIDGGRGGGSQGVGGAVKALRDAMAFAYEKSDTRESGSVISWIFNSAD